MLDALSPSVSDTSPTPPKASVTGEPTHKLSSRLTPRSLVRTTLAPSKLEFIGVHWNIWNSSDLDAGLDSISRLTTGYC